MAVVSHLSAGKDCFSSMSLCVFMYHRILPSPHPEAVALPQFQHQLDFLQKHFDILTPNEVFDYIHNGKVPRKNRNYAALTFDDGWADNLFYATDELKKRGLQAMMAVSAGFAHKGEIRSGLEESALRRPTEAAAAAARAGNPENYLSEDELKYLISTGVWSLENHGVRHYLGSKRKSVLAAPQGEEKEAFLEKLRIDILSSRAYLDELTGRRGRIFFWPYGHYSTPAAEVVQECGYDIQFSVYKGACRPKDKRLVLPRIGVSRCKKLHKNSFVFSHAILEKLHGLFHVEQVCFDDFYQDEE